MLTLVPDAVVCPPLKHNIILGKYHNTEKNNFSFFSLIGSLDFGVRPGISYLTLVKVSLLMVRVKESLNDDL